MSKTTQENENKESIGLRLRKKIPDKAECIQDTFGKASRFVVSSQIWLNTIPTRDCDVLVTFPKHTATDTLQWLLSRVKRRSPELKVYVRHHTNTGQYGFYFTATFHNLLNAAEELSIQKRVKEQYGGGMKEYVDSDRDNFLGIDDCTSFLTSQERQICVKHMLDNLRAQEGDVLLKTKFLEGQALIPILLSKRVIDQVLPLHCSEDLSHLREHWMKTFHRRQPLDKICDYFGVKIAMYFAYLGHYTVSLLLPTFIGMALWFISGASQVTDDYCFVIFAFINVVWATLYLEAWKRKSAEFAYEWGTLDCEDELLVEPRPLYHGYLVKSKVTDRYETHYPAWKRIMFKYLVGWPIIALCLVFVFVVMWCIFELQDWINGKIGKGHLPGPLSFFPKILLAVSIGVLDDIYKKIAVWLNKKENYRLEETYENNLIVKLVLFQFVNSFLSLFYIAFYLQDMDRLRDQLAMLLITRQVIGNLKESVLPYVLSKLKLFRMGYQMTEAMSPGSIEKQAKQIIDNRLRTISSCCDKSNTPQENNQNPADDQTEDHTSELPKDDQDTHANHTQHTDEADPLSAFRPELAEEQMGASGPQLTQAEVEASLKQYEDTFEDHLEMFIQFGYVTLFSSAFPLAALCAILNNIIEIRSDAFKLCMTFQRPFGQRVNSIGTWQDALEVMSVIAVMVNCALIGMSDLADRMFPNYSTSERLVLIVILEHIILAAKQILAYSIPDTPHWVAEAKARLEFLRRQALKKIERSTSKENKSSEMSDDSSISNKSDTPEITPVSTSSPMEYVDNTSSVSPSAENIEPLQPKKVDVINKQPGRPRSLHVDYKQNRSFHSNSIRNLEPDSVKTTSIESESMITSRMGEPQPKCSAIDSCISKTSMADSNMGEPLQFGSLEMAKPMQPESTAVPCTRQYRPKSLYADFHLGRSLDGDSDIGQSPEPPHSVIKTKSTNPETLVSKPNHLDRSKSLSPESSQSKSMDVDTSVRHKLEPRVSRVTDALRKRQLGLTRAKTVDNTSSSRSQGAFVSRAKIIFESKK